MSERGATTRASATAADRAAEPSRLARLRAFGRRHSTLIAVVGSVATVVALAWVLAGRRHEFATALTAAPLGVLALTTLLQVVALLARTEAWHLTIEAAGGRVSRRILYRSASVQVLGGVFNAQLGVAARIAALRRSSPALSPQVPTLIAAEFPIVVIEAMWGALASFTLIAPLGLPWWAPVLALSAMALVCALLRQVALRAAREVWKGLAVLGSLVGASRVVACVMVAVTAQIFRNMLLLHAVGVDASFLDSTAVLIAVSTLMQLPLGPGAAAAASILILGSDGVAATAAAGVLMTVTGTAGGLCFAAWAGLDLLWAHSPWSAQRRRRPPEPPTAGAGVRELPAEAVAREL